MVCALALLYSTVAVDAQVMFSGMGRALVLWVCNVPLPAPVVATNSSYVTMSNVQPLLMVTVELTVRSAPTVLVLLPVQVSFSYVPSTIVTAPPLYSTVKFQVSPLGMGDDVLCVFSVPVPLVVPTLDRALVTMSKFTPLLIVSVPATLRFAAAVLVPLPPQIRLL